jgi:hypothetical protein
MMPKAVSFGDEGEPPSPTPPPDLGSLQVERQSAYIGNCSQVARRLVLGRVSQKYPNYNDL